jgi:pimeloyl-ACP methyl ester carboxylesterase
MMALNWVNLTRQDNQARGLPMSPEAALRLWDVRVPVLAISGRFDTIGSQRSMAYLAQQAPEGRLVEMDSAHLPSIEQPERFNELVLGFLAEVSAAG